MSKRPTTPPESSEVTTALLTIDAFEGDKARIELPDGRLVDYDRARLPREAKEGDVLHVQGKGEAQTFEIDHAETEKRRMKAQATLDALNQAAPSGEITL